MLCVLELFGSLMVILDMFSCFLVDTGWIMIANVTLFCLTRTLYASPCSLTPLKDDFGFLVFFFFSIKCSPPLLSYCSTSFVAFLPTSCLFVCGFSILLWFLRDCITLYPFVSIGGLFHLWVSVLQKERTRFFCFSYAPLHTSVYIKAAQ